MIKQAEMPSPQSSASEYQAEFSKALFNPEIPAPDFAVNPEGAHAPKRFAVYRNNVVVSLLDSMEDGFPASRALLGQEYFRALSREYINAHPPSSPLMFLFGEHFSEFARAFPPLENYRYVADVAELEYARRLAYYAADENLLPRKELEALDPSNLVNAHLKLHPAFFVVKSKYPVYDLYERASGKAEHEIGSTGQEVVVSRPKLEVLTALAPEGLFSFVEALGTSCFGAAIETVLAEHPAADIPALIPIVLNNTIKVVQNDS